MERTLLEGETLSGGLREGGTFESHPLTLSTTSTLSLQTRYVGAQNYKDAIDLLHSGSLLLLKHKQGGSGTDLALYLIEVYNLNKLPVTDETRGKVIAMPTWHIGSLGMPLMNVLHTLPVDINCPLPTMDTIMDHNVFRSYLRPS